MVKHLIDLFNVDAVAIDRQNKSSLIAGIKNKLLLESDNQ
jgi:hypothetical protein